MHTEETEFGDADCRKWTGWGGGGLGLPRMVSTFPAREHKQNKHILEYYGDDWYRVERSVLLY